MFSWICPQCGREVPPSYTECPNCKGKGASGAAPPPQQGQPVYAQQGPPQGPPPGYPPPPAQPAYPWPPQPGYQQAPPQPGYQPGPPPPNYQQMPPQPGYQQGPPQPSYQWAPPQPGYQPGPPPPNYQQMPPQPVYQQAPPQSYPQAPPEPSYQQAPPEPSYQQQAPSEPSYQQAPTEPGYQQAPPAASPPLQQYTVPAPRSGLPTWLMTILFAVGFVVIVGGIYWLVGSHGNGQTASAPPTNVESPAAKPAGPANPLQKYVEVSGIRFAEDAKKNIVVKCTVTNHSDEYVSGLAANVTIWGRTQKSEEDAVGTFSFATDVGAQTSKEVSAPLTTKLKIYELPDWQNVTTDLQVTAPQ